MGNKSAFARVPNRPLSYDKISEITNYRGVFDSVNDLPSDAKEGDYAHVNEDTYKYSNGWNRLDPQYFINPVKKELIVDYLRHIIYLCDADGNIIKASASAETIIDEVMDQIANDPVYLKEIQITINEETGETVSLEKGLVDTIGQLEIIREEIKASASAETIIDEVMDRIANDPVYLKEIQITINEETGETVSLEKGLVDTIGQLETIREEWDSKSSVHNVTATISSAQESWVLDSDKGAYIQTIKLADILETDYPIVDVCLSDNYNTALSELNEYGKIYKILTFNGYIDVYANAPTSVDLNIILKIDR